MATTINAGATTGINMNNLDHIEVRGVAQVITFFYKTGPVQNVTGADAADFIANGLPFLAAQAPLQYYPLA